jgi:hypothetical protein
MHLRQKEQPARQGRVFLRFEGVCTSPTRIQSLRGHGTVALGTHPAGTLSSMLQPPSWCSVPPSSGRPSVCVARAQQDKQTGAAGHRSCASRTLMLIGASRVQPV